jgi:organic radical activating enzyme
MELTKEDKELIKKAKSMVNKKRIYSGSLKAVGSALITKKGKEFTGANWDLWCGVGFCAESSAISNMISHSNETEIKEYKGRTGMTIISTRNKINQLKLPVLHSLSQDAIEDIYRKLDTVKSIYLAGGEPLLEENNVKLLNYLIENNLTPELNYNTNLTTITFKNINYFELWKHFPKIELTVSVDGYKEVNDYIRFGSSYDKLISNIRTIKENVPHARIVINTVASNMSMHSLPELGKNLIQHNIIDDMMFSICHFPKIYDPTVLTSESKQDITKLFDDYVFWLKSQTTANNSFIHGFVDKCIGLVDYMNSEDNSALLSDTKNTLSIQDKFRNTDHTKVLKL